MWSAVLMIWGWGLGNGYKDHVKGKRDGARLLRVEQTKNFSVHDIVLVDAPM